MTSQFEQWRDAESGRLKWEYLLDKKGKPTKVLVQLLEAVEAEKGTKNFLFHEVILKILPHYVWCSLEKDIPNRWMKENIAGAWTIWGRPGQDHPDNTIYTFEHAADAIYFKLRWL